MTDSMSLTGTNQKFASWDAAYIGLRPRLTPTALRLSNGNMADAEDLIQNTFLRAFRYCEDLQDLNDPAKFFRTILYNSWKRKLRRDEVGLEDVNPQDPNMRVPSDIQETLESSEVFENLLKLGFLTRAEKALLRAYLNDFTLDEIAVACGEDAGLTKARWYKMIAKLREYFKKNKK